MDFIVDTLLKALFIQLGMILGMIFGGNILPIFLHAFFGMPYMVL